MDIKTDSLAQKAERASVELIHLAIAIIRIVLESVFFPNRVIKTISSDMPPDKEGIGAALYLVVCSFLAITLPNYIARSAGENNPDGKFSDFFVSLSFDSILMRILPTLLTCYVTCSFYARRNHRAEPSSTPLENYTSQYLYAAGFAILYGTLAVSLTLFAQEKLSINVKGGSTQNLFHDLIDYFSVIPIVAFFFVVFVLERGFTNQSARIYKTDKHPPKIFTAFTFAVLIWYSCIFWGWLDWKLAPQVEDGSVHIEQAWLESTESETKITVYFANNTKNHVYFPPGILGLSIGAPNAWMQQIEGNVSQDSSVKSLSPPGSSGTIVITTMQLDPKSLRVKLPFIATGVKQQGFLIGMDELQSASKPQISRVLPIITMFIIPLRYIQSEELRNAIATSWERKNEEKAREKLKNN